MMTAVLRRSASLFASVPAMLSLMLLLLFGSSNVTAQDGGDMTTNCLATPEALLQTVASDGDSRSVPTIYVICPGSVWTVDSNTFVLPIVDNAIYQCGTDGNPANQCVLTGGAAQMAATSSQSTGATVTLHIRGITFDNAQSVAFVIQQYGTIDFVHCVFQNHIAADLVGFFNPPVLVANDDMDFGNDGQRQRKRQRRQRRMLPETEPRRDVNDEPPFFDAASLWDWATDPTDDQQPTRFLQDSTPSPRLTVTFDGCTFAHNQQKQTEMAANGMLLTNTNRVDLVVRNCQFQNNTYAGKASDGGVEVGYIAFVRGGTLTAENNCIAADNAFRGFGILQVANNGTAVAVDNFVEEPSDISSSNMTGINTTCQFIAVVPNPVEPPTECVDAESMVCAAAIPEFADTTTTDDMTLMPTDTAAPVAAPADGATEMPVIGGTATPTIMPTPSGVSRLRVLPVLLLLLVPGWWAAF